MIDLQVYAAGLRGEDYILQLGHALEMYRDLRYKLDPDHDMVYFEFEPAATSLREIRGIFEGIGLEPRFVGEIPPEITEAGTKTERIQV